MSLPDPKQFHPADMTLSWIYDQIFVQRIVNQISIFKPLTAEELAWGHEVVAITSRVRPAASRPAEPAHYIGQIAIRHKRKTFMQAWREDVLPVLLENGALKPLPNATRPDPEDEAVALESFRRYWKRVKKTPMPWPNVKR